MLQIQNTLVSLDVIEKFFCCNLDKCKGQCCIEGDAGAPITHDEETQIREHWPKASAFMNQKAIDKIESTDISYVDSEGDLVTTIIDNRDCVFTCHEGDLCLCALEKAYRKNMSPFIKPISCALYPIRLTEYPTFTAVNLHKWDICKDAYDYGKHKGIRVYQFLKEPLIRKFGKEWYDELELMAGLYLQEKEKKK